jgi:methylated-DNA-[protein]-cysteine S-methyltransferase
MATRLAIFRTQLGWFGLSGRAGVVETLWMGHADADEVRDRASRTLTDGWDEGRWSPELQQRLIDYARGAVDDFRDVRIADRGATEFQRRVIRELRRIGYGRTVSYGELAELAGAPRAARAVGTVMKHNHTPLLVPCHRVIAAAGKLGGFSAPQGVSLKRQLLELEARGVAGQPPR